MTLKRSQCRSCKMTILWTVTQVDKRMPVDVLEDIVNGNLEVYLDKDGVARSRVIRGDYSGKRFTSHFKTCAQANEWRK